MAHEVVKTSSCTMHMQILAKSSLKKHVKVVCYTVHTILWKHTLFWLYPEVLPTVLQQSRGKCSCTSRAHLTSVPHPGCTAKAGNYSCSHQKQLNSFTFKYYRDHVNQEAASSDISKLMRFCSKSAINNSQCNSTYRIPHWKCNRIWIFRLVHFLF